MARFGRHSVRGSHTPGASIETPPPTLCAPFRAVKGNVRALTPRPAVPMVRGEPIERISPWLPLLPLTP